MALLRKTHAPGGPRGHRRELVGAVVGVLLITAVLVVAFGKNQLRPGETRIQAVFADANQLKPGSTVRIAGLDIGRVTGVHLDGDRRALVDMSLRRNAPGIHADARFTIRPRLAFEGNFYVDVDPGERGPLIDAGTTIPLRQTAGPVQIDQVVSELTTPVREGAKNAVGELGAALGTGDGAASGAAGLRRASRAFADALPDVRRVSSALRGERQGDLVGAIRGARELLGELGEDQRSLADLVTNYDRVFAVTAEQQSQIAGSLRGLDRVLASAPSSLAAIDGLLPPLRSTGVALRPVLRALPRASDSFRLAVQQYARLGDSSELPGLARELDRPVRELPELERRIAFAMPLVTPVARCVTEKVLPVLNDKIIDGPHTTDQPIWQEFLHMGASLTGASSDFDANGTTIRAGLGTAEDVVLHDLPGIGKVYTQLTQGVTGISPKWLGFGVKPPKRPDQPCVEQERVDLRDRAHDRPMTVKEQFGAEARVVPAPKQTAETQERLRDELGALRSKLARSLGEEDGR